MQFQTEDRAKQFKDNFMSLAGSEELDHITGPTLVGFITDDLKMDSRWQIMDKTTLEKFKANEWVVVYSEDEWKPRLSEAELVQEMSISNIKLDIWIGISSISCKYSLI